MPMNRVPADDEDRTVRRDQRPGSIGRAILEGGDQIWENKN